MENISPSELAERALSEEGDESSRALFANVIEPMADRFEPSLCDEYAEFFAGVIAKAIPSLNAAELVARYQEVRRVRPVAFEPEDVFVLSRVTLGADVAVTSIVMDGARRRFPGARLWFAGPKKAWELFEKSPDFRHLPVDYGRTARLRDRLAAFEPLREALDQPGALVLDPDSRLTQLGLLPVIDASRHHLFESRSFGGDGTDALPQLTQRWVAQTLGIEDAEPWLHPKFTVDIGEQPLVTVSLGVGENPAKRVGELFEERLLRRLADIGAPVLVDAGAPRSEEENRVREAIERSGAAGRIGLHEGSFASFAAWIAASKLYVGYDSAAQHVAAALGVPLVTFFAGYPSQRMFERWKPYGPGPRTVVPATRVYTCEKADALLEAAADALRIA